MDATNLRTVTTGVGKSCSAYSITKALHGHSYSGVINVGTAGSALLNIGDIIVSYRFIDRDLAACNIPNISFRQEFAKWMDLPSVINGAECSSGDYVVSTGDSFVTSPSDIEGDAVDMEAFAQAMVCHEEGVPFLSVKYITDKIGSNSIKSWKERLGEARESLNSYFKQHILRNMRLS